MQSQVFLILLVLLFQSYVFAQDCADPRKLTRFSALFGVAPSNVVIGENQQVYFDLPTCFMDGGITIQNGSNLFFPRDSAVNLTVRYIKAYGGLHIGSETCPAKGNIHITLTQATHNFDKLDINVSANGAIELHGANVCFNINRHSLCVEDAIESKDKIAAVLRAATISEKRSVPNAMDDAIVVVAHRNFTVINRCPFPVETMFTNGAEVGKWGTTSCNTTADCNANSECLNNICFFNAPTLLTGSNTLQVNGAASYSIPIYTNQYIAWSGNVHGHQLFCNGSDCTIYGPQVITQAEFTFSVKGSDFYDVEVINGVGLSTAIYPQAPSNTTYDAHSPYTCGSPGSVVPSSNLLGGCSWSFTPPAIDYVQVTAGGAECSSISNCKVPGETCGLSYTMIPGVGPLMKMSCGKPVGFWTANQVCALDSNYVAGSFNCNQIIKGSKNQDIHILDLLGCTGTVGSCYQPQNPNENTQNTDCCGCPNWAGLGITMPSDSFSYGCMGTNPRWTQHVQPGLHWIKSAAPTAYTFPYDDATSTFTCAAYSSKSNGNNIAQYTIEYCPSIHHPPSIFT